MWFIFILVTRVDNQCGPQTLTQPKREPSLHQIAPSGGSKPQLIDGVEERLCNMEDHLGLTHGEFPVVCPCMHVFVCARTCVCV